MILSATIVAGEAGVQFRLIICVLRIIRRMLGPTTRIGRQRRPDRGDIRRLLEVLRAPNRHGTDGPSAQGLGKVAMVALLPGSSGAGANLCNTMIWAGLHGQSALIWTLEHVYRICRSPATNRKRPLQY